MATRPIYTPGLRGEKLVVSFAMEFKWFPGLATTQKQKSIRALHEAASQRNIRRVLEISSKSELSLGQALSAFNLPISTPSGIRTRVENAFQASKVFHDGGPFVDLLSVAARDAKKDPRIKQSGALSGFRLDGKDWPLWPRTGFYDWLYLTALSQSDLARHLLEYDGFAGLANSSRK